MNEKKIIQIAANTNFYGLKDNCSFKSKATNKICGDQIAVEIDKNFNFMRYESQSCIFTQASASILANNFTKIYRYGLKNVLKYIKKKLNGESANLPFKIKEMDVLVNKQNKNRKECITLPYDAILKITND